MATEPAQAPAPTSARHPGSGRRTLLRALTGTGALTALSLPAAPDAGAAVRRPAGESATADPFAVDRFRPTGRVREYWVQADSFSHNALPSGYDPLTGMRFGPRDTTFPAIGFRAYTPHWGRPLPGDDDPHGIGPNTGIPGPVLRGHVGDVIRVHFRNNDTHYRWPHSVHAHGLRYSPASDGAWMAADPERPGTAVPFGGTYTYTWRCTPGSVGSWPYHDHSAPQLPPAPGKAKSGPPQGSSVQDLAAAAKVMEIGADLGLFGMIAVTGEQTAPVDREFVLFFHELTTVVAPSLKTQLAMFNGRACPDDAPRFTARTGDRVRWRIASLGDSFHTFHIHGHRWRTADGWTDTQVLGPATTLTVEYTEDDPGDWLYHCHLPNHMMHGMAGRYVVTR